MKTKIYGASDDLIEIDGPCSEEIGCYDHKKPIKIEISDGTKATIFYDRSSKAFQGTSQAESLCKL